MNKQLCLTKLLAQSYEEILIPPNISVEKVENKSKIQKKRRLPAMERAVFCYSGKKIYLLLSESS